MSPPVRISQPKPLLTVPEAKKHCNATAPDDDALIAGLIAAAEAYLDGRAGVLGRAMVAQTWQQDFADFGDILRLPLGDLMTVVTVSYYDVLNIQRTLDSSVYVARTDEHGPFITLNPGQSWPATFLRDDAVRVIWRAGYGETPAAVPANIRLAALLLVGLWYDTRAAATAASPSEVPFAVSALVAPHRRIRI